LFKEKCAENIPVVKVDKGRWDMANLGSGWWIGKCHDKILWFLQEIFLYYTL